MLFGLTACKPPNDSKMKQHDLLSYNGLYGANNN